MVVTVVLVGLRTWTLSQAHWQPIDARAVEVDPSLLRAGPDTTRSMGGSCAGPASTTASWRLGPRLVLHVARIPDGTRRPAIEQSVRHAVAAFGQRSGPCGRGPLADWAEVGQATSSAAGVVVAEGDARCGSPDGTSVIEWGDLPGPRLGLTCVFQRLDRQGVPRVVEADIRLDAAQAWVVGTRWCDAAYDVQSVLTHELGHVVGLDHPLVEETGTDLTMSRDIAPCDTSARTLAGPDLAALSSLLP